MMPTEGPTSLKSLDQLQAPSNLLTSYYWTPSVAHRRLIENDLGALKYLHDALFPINYHESFFIRAVRGDGIIGWAAVLPQTEASERFPDATTVFVGNEQFVGFITGREFGLHEIPATDRRLLGLEGPEHDDSMILYILTLGVAESFRKHGIATSLLKRMEAHAAQSGCIALYLHVISYNEAATKFYSRSGFNRVAELQNFYHIQTGRALHADIKNYDAYIYSKEIKKPLEELNHPRHALTPSTTSIWTLWAAISKLCLSLWRNSRQRKDILDNGIESMAPDVVAAPGWLRGLFTGKPSARRGIEHIA